MDYLDTKKETRHRYILFTGYILIAAGIVIATLILVYQAYGFGVKRDGTVIQNGLAFFSSHPNPADIYVNGKLSKERTNTRLALPAAIYQVTLTRDGYHSWQRKVAIEGGNVYHYDYPFLIPKDLTPKRVVAYESMPAIFSQSPDRRWLLLQRPGPLTAFELYDLKNPKKLAENISQISFPAQILSKATGTESLSAVDWADDNEHVLLLHTYDDKTEYILLDRTNPERSINLNITLGASPTKLTLKDRKYDKYYLYDASTASLRSATLGTPQPTDVLDRVLAYQSYGKDSVLYVTDLRSPAGKVTARLLSGDQTYTLKTFPAGSSYLVDLTKYSNDLYVVIGAANQDKVYIYKDPIGQLREKPQQALVPVQVLHVAKPNFLDFSDSAQFIAVEGGNQFGLYDIENKKGYNYTTTQPLDTGQTHASWMDGNRLSYISGGTVLIFDYDYMNVHTLSAAAASMLPGYSSDYNYIYTLAPVANTPQYELLQTPLLTTQDLP
jgi:hypothetical protein